MLCFQNWTKFDIIREYFIIVIRIMLYAILRTGGSLALRSILTAERLSSVPAWLR